MSTKKLYQDNVYLKAASGNIVEILENHELNTLIEDGILYLPNSIRQAMKTDNKKYLALALDKSIFFPEGGGQPSDIGLIQGFNVIYTWENKKNHKIFHLIELNDDDVPPQLTQEVSMEIDWNRRFENMQRHCGEHILSGVIYDLTGGVNRGFHMGEKYMTIDISIEDENQEKYLSAKQIAEAQRLTNKIIWDNLPVVTHHFTTKKEALNSKIKVRKPLTIEEDITIVTIGDENRPADSVACCGTHPAFTGQVGLLKIYKWEKNKSMTRIYFDSGSNAFNHLNHQSLIMNRLNNCLSASTDDVSEKLDKLYKNLREEKEKVAALTTAILENKKNEVLTSLAEGKTTIAAEKAPETPLEKPLKTPLFYLDGLGQLNQKDLQRLGKMLLNDSRFKTTAVIQLIEKIEYNNSDNNKKSIKDDGNKKWPALLVSREFNCNTIIAEIKAKGIDISGGGGAESGQIQGTQRDIKSFANYIHEKKGGRFERS